MDPFSSIGGLVPRMPYRRTPAPKVSLASRSHIECMDAGLSSVLGAQDVIKQMLSRRSVTKLILGHNDLGDLGCEELFGFLSSPAGRKYKITQISLNANRIGNRGLLAITRYLRDNTTLKELFLQNNAFVGDPHVANSLAYAINASHLETLVLNTNPQLSDTFVQHFLPFLDSPHFHEIHLSVLGLTHVSGQHIVEFIASPRCQLHTLKVNGNHLRIRAVRSILRAIRSANYTLLRVEMYATGITERKDNSDRSPSEDEGETKGSITSWKDYENDLKRILTRNSTLKYQVEKEALNLLRYSRPLLLRPQHRDTTASSTFTPCSESCSCAKASGDSLFSSIGQTYALPSIPITSPGSPSFPFTALPTELQLHILSFLAPILSTAQRIRIFTFASSPSTLPPLLPCLSGGGGCIPDPASLQFNLGAPPLATSGPLTLAPGGGLRLRKPGVESSASSPCANGKCMGAGNSVLCRREAQRSQWLASVRCNAFELEDAGTPLGRPAEAGKE